MVQVIFDLHDERHAVCVPARQAAVTDTRTIEHRFQLVQVAPRKPDVHPIVDDRNQHVFTPFNVRRGPLANRDDPFMRKFGSSRPAHAIALISPNIDPKGHAPDEIEARDVRPSGDGRGSLRRHGRKSVESHE